MFLISEHPKVLNKPHPLGSGKTQKLFDIQMIYKDELTKAMEYLAKDDRVIFLGQAIKYKGSPMYQSLCEVSNSKKIELPLIEDVQMGMSIGLSLMGYVPVSIFPRFDFLLCATNQLVNHLDKIKEMSDGQFNPKVIIRTAIGSTKPLYPGLQHCSDYTEAFQKMLKNVKVIKLENKERIFQEYKEALEREGSTLLIEVCDRYTEE